MKCPKCGAYIPDNRFQVGKEKARSGGFHRAFEPWMIEEDKKLKEMVQAGKDLLEMSQALGRQPSAIQRRMDLYQLVIQTKSQGETGGANKIYNSGEETK